MLISENIPLPVDGVIKEIMRRQSESWNNGRINDYLSFPLLQELFSYINWGIPKQDFFYQGDLFRIHGSQTKHVSSVDLGRERIISKPCSDGSCRVLPITEYTEKLVSFSKNHDFTRKCYYKVDVDIRAVLFFCNTRRMYGIDVNTFLHKYGYRNELYEEEQEVLFPLMKDYIIKEYSCTPNQFNYYLR